MLRAHAVLALVAFADAFTNSRFDNVVACVALALASSSTDCVTTAQLLGPKLVRAASLGDYK